MAIGAINSIVMLVLPPGMTMFFNDTAATETYTSVVQK
jgi:hypothetical protein